MNPLIAPDDRRCSLSVNVNKVALLRNTRHLGIPSVLRAAEQCLLAWKREQLYRTGLLDFLRSTWTRSLMEQLFHQREGELGRGPLHEDAHLVGFDGHRQPLVENGHQRLEAIFLFDRPQDGGLQPILQLEGPGAAGIPLIDEAGAFDDRHQAFSRAQQLGHRLEFVG